jgi:HxlR-like helix-turn-helix
MVADGMLTRKRYREVPPRVDYELTERARDLMPVLGELARWGYTWVWSAPRTSESVDLGAIFRLVPGLTRPTETAGTVEFTVSDGADAEAASVFTFTIANNRVEVRESPADEPNVRVKGDRPAWITALSPEHDRRGLAVEGDDALATWLLDDLTAAAAERAPGSAAAAA